MSSASWFRFLKSPSARQAETSTPDKRGAGGGRHQQNQQGRPASDGSKRSSKSETVSPLWMLSQVQKLLGKRIKEDIYSEAAAREWVICMPAPMSLQNRDVFSRDFVLSHVLEPIKFDSASSLSNEQLLDEPVVVVAAPLELLDDVVVSISAKDIQSLPRDQTWSRTLGGFLVFFF